MRNLRVLHCCSSSIGKALLVINFGIINGLDALIAKGAGRVSFIERLLLGKTEETTLFGGKPYGFFKHLPKLVKACLYPGDIGRTKRRGVNE